jgi:hypothetical protein
MKKIPPFSGGGVWAEGRCRKNPLGALEDSAFGAHFPFTFYKNFQGGKYRNSESKLEFCFVLSETASSTKL